MATYRAVAAVSRAILKLLEDGCPRGEFPNAQFELQQVLDFQKGPLAEGVSLVLYRVAVTVARRNLPPRVEPDGRRFRAPLPLDLFYALCIWGRSVEVQQRLFGFCARALEDTPILPSGLLNQAGPEAVDVSRAGDRADRPRGALDPGSASALGSAEAERAAHHDVCRAHGASRFADSAHRTPARCTHVVFDMVGGPA